MSQLSIAIIATTVAVIASYAVVMGLGYCIERYSSHT